MTRGVVSKCREVGIHTIPKAKNIQGFWLKAIHLGELIPEKTTELCGKHFVENGVKYQQKSAGGIPIFSCQSEIEKGREYNLVNCNFKKRKLYGVPSNTHSLDNIWLLEEYRSVFEACNGSRNLLTECSSCPKHKTPKKPKNKTFETQTSNILRLFSTEVLLADDETVYFYTGFDKLIKFRFVFMTLLPKTYDFKYRSIRIVSLSIEDQFLMLLIKFKRNTTDFELGKMFGVRETQVSHIILIWINFVTDIWSVIETLPNRRLVNLYMPHSFKKHCPSTSLILPGTKLDAEEPSQSNSQRASFHSISQIPGVQSSNQTLIDQRVHMKKLIGLTKTYLFLKYKLNHVYLPLAPKIFYICVILCHFRKAL